jgi:hypothetical protein
MTSFPPVIMPKLENAKDQKEIDLLRTLNRLVDNLRTILDRGVQFEDNIDCRMISFTSNASPNTEDTVAHTLGKTPQGYIIYSKDKAGDLYTSTGGTAWDATNMYLKCTVASVAFKIIVI